MTIRSPLSATHFTTFGKLSYLHFYFYHIRPSLIYTLNQSLKSLVPQTFIIRVFLLAPNTEFINMTFIIRLATVASEQVSSIHCNHHIAGLGLHKLLFPQPVLADLLKYS